ncbi:MAG: YihY/virulence factor BrkB family protein [Janthinobacterium lividum]
MNDSGTKPNLAPARPAVEDNRLKALDADAQHIWNHVSHSPMSNLWNFEGTPPLTILKRSAKAFIDDNLVSRAAELGYYFLFALFPTLLSASSILGLLARKASTIYVGMLDYLSIVIPHSAFQMVIDTFNQTAAASSGGKITFGLAAALWSASVGFAAIQDTANIVYKVRETRPYWKAKLQAILVTVLLSVVITSTLAILLTADFLDKRIVKMAQNHVMQVTETTLVHLASWSIVLALLMLLFGIIYYFAPDLKTKCWHWLTPGAAIGIFGWLAASLGFRAYLHYFPSYSATYGSLGAVIVLLTWFYVTGLMLLAGAEINSEIQAAVTEKRLKEQGVLPDQVTTDPEHPVTAGA